MLETLESTAEAPNLERLEVAALPVCLTPWRENSYRLVSLLNMMLRIKAGELCRASSLIGQLHGSVQVQYGSSISSSVWSIIAPQLGMLERVCEELKLSTALAQIKRVKPHFVGEAPDSGSSVPHLVQEITEVYSRLADELDSRYSLIVDQTDADYLKAFGTDYDPAKPSPIEVEWSSVFVAFPGVKYDALEALKSFALSRNTACVFHLMRVMELGLSALGAVFGVSLAHTNWAPAIEQIESKIRDMHKDPMWKARPDFKEQQEFYSQAASTFGILKDAWRNYTAHARGKYDAQEASDILASVRAFMQRLVEQGLHE